MGTLDQVIQMKNQGISDEEIASKLQEQKVSPKEINDAMNQSKIKNAVSDIEGMQPSIMNSPKPTSNKEDIYVPQAQEYEQEIYAPQAEYQQEEYSPQTGYNEYSSQTGTDTDTMIEIAEQVFSQKMESISKEIKTLIEFKTIYSSKIDDVNQRLKRIENQFDKMQIAILDKVGKFGKNLDSLKKEIDMVEDSFSKMNSRL